MKANIIAAALVVLSSVGRCVADDGEVEVQSKRTYLFAFGDSYTRTGWQPCCEVPTDENPMANPTPGDTSTGGFNWVGYLTSIFNDGTVYLYNYAGAGAVVRKDIVSTEQRPVKPQFRDFVLQTDQFVDAVGLKPEWAPWDASNAIAAIWMGGCDVFRTYDLENHEDLHRQVTEEYLHQVDRMYGVGVRKFIFLYVPPTFLTPLRYFPETLPYKQRKAGVEELNQMLRKAFAKYAKKQGDIRYRFVETIGAFTTAFQNPGMFNAHNASCHGHSPYCLWWNAYHPSEGIHKLVAVDVVKAWNAPPFHCPESIPECTSTPVPTYKAEKTKAFAPGGEEPVQTGEPQGASPQEEDAR